jgi:hypothetical protein
MGTIAALSAGVAIAAQTGAIKLGRTVSSSVVNAPSDTVLDGTAPSIGASTQDDGLGRDGENSQGTFEENPDGNVVGEEVSMSNAVDPGAVAAAPDTVVRYEDVYVVDPAPSTPTAAAAAAPAAAPAGRPVVRATPVRKPRTTSAVGGTHESADVRASDRSEGPDHEQERNADYEDVGSDD